MSKEMFESYKSFFTSHMNFLKDFAPKEMLKIRRIHHFVFALSDDENKVLGFRFLAELSHTVFTLVIVSYAER